MDSKEIKLDLLQGLIENQDTEAIKKMQVIHSFSISELTTEQGTILEERIKRLKTELAKYSSRKDAKSGIAKREN